MTAAKDATVPLTPNNFDLLRLIAAMQVMLAHYDHYVFHSSGLLEYLPGVPIFFFISGFLVSTSWERTPDIADYARNRLLRIYPALWAVWIFTLVTLLLFYDHNVLLEHWERVAAWSAMQITIFQDWYPAIFNGFGTGILNGSLWTIPVEIGFYVLTPLLYTAMRKLGRPTLVLFLVTGLCWCLLVALTLPALAGPAPRWVEWLSLSPLPWLGMFTMGVLAQRHRSRLQLLLRNAVLPILLIYVTLAALAAHFPFYPFLRADGNAMGVLNYPVLCALVLAAAYTFPWLADRLLRRNDISYGVYLFHLPLLNLSLALGLTGTSAYIASAAGTLLIAMLSWLIVEKPALSQRHNPLLARVPR